MWLPVMRPHGPGELVRLHDDVGAERRGERLLVRVAGADDDLHVGHVPAQAGDRGQTHRAGAEHGDDRTLDAAEHGPGEQRGVDAAGSRFDEHGLLVGHRVGHRVQLAVVGDELRVPSHRTWSCRTRSGCPVRAWPVTRWA